MKNRIGSLLVWMVLVLTFKAGVALAYYDPEIGRFIQPDTDIPDLSNPQSYNRYSYVLNNPLRYTDPDGKAPSDWANTMQPGIDIYYGGYIANPSHTSTIGLFGAYMGQGVANGYNDMLRFGTGMEKGTLEGVGQDIGRGSERGGNEVSPC
jgi:hypothetical protein